MKASVTVVRPGREEGERDERERRETSAELHFSLKLAAALYAQI